MPKKNIDLTQNRAPLEGNFVLSLYKDPGTLYDDYPINPDTDLLTADGKFYYNLGLNMERKGLKTFDEISVLTFLNDVPEIKAEFEQKGGWKAVEECMSVLEPDNIEAYYNELVKNNLLIQLDKKGFDISGHINDLNKLNTADQVIDYFDYQLNSAALNMTHDITLEKLSYTKDDLQKKQSGEMLGLNFSENSPMLNSCSNGIPRKGLTMLASYTNGGKTSFVFENIVLPILKQQIKVCVISNEQDCMVFKDLLYIHVLTKELNYFNISRTKIKSLDFTDEDKIYFKKAHKIVKEKYEPYILFQRMYDYSMKGVKRTIRKLAKQNFQLFIYDTFKVDSTTDSIWQSFLNDSKELFQIASKENMAIITPVQIAASTKGKIRMLNESVLSNSKQIAEIYEEIFMFRDIWRDEYTDKPKSIHPFEYVQEDGGYTNVKQEINITEDDGEHYKIFFHVKSRNGDVGQQVLYKFIPYSNQWIEIGFCRVDDENRL